MAFWGKARRASDPSASPEAGFGAAAYARLAGRIERALGIAESRQTAVIASVTVPVPRSIRFRT
ncbi:MAG: hypothetical protein QM648_12160 [Solirubrobacterales bacterium]